ncbi:hypothetical protein JKP88DRAFT_288130 [Tribonema minus]|uniref:Uncharacterized protein n=1 Tax=Tribonema minus TaxID=303371 RepID=A0A835Z7P8_9STRA|nr:hypothetical protein JKP88DRAFT_288130 [Tribonema minus]
MEQLAELLQKGEQQEEIQQQEQQRQQQHCQQHEQQQQQLEENRQQRLTNGDLQLENGRQQQRLRELEEDNKRQRAASEQQQGRLRELEEDNRQLRVTIANQRRTSEAKQQQHCQATGVVRTAHGAEQQGAGMLGGDERVNRQSSLVPPTEEGEPQIPATETAGGSGGGISHTKAVTRPVGEALTAGDAGGSDDDCSGNDHNIHSLDVDANHDSVSQEVAENSCHESETHTDTGDACSAGSDASDSTYVCSDNGEHV